MLSLSRESNESLIIEHEGETLTIHFKINQNRARMAFDGPLSFRITRSNAVKAQNKTRPEKEGASEQPCFVTLPGETVNRLAAVVSSFGSEPQCCTVRLNDGRVFHNVPCDSVKKITAQ